MPRAEAYGSYAEGGATDYAEGGATDYAEGGATDYAEGGATDYAEGGATEAYCNRAVCPKTGDVIFTSFLIFKSPSVCLSVFYKHFSSLAKN